MTLIPLSEATVEDLIRDITHWEDPDSYILVNHTEDGRIYLIDYQGYYHVEADTLRDALIEYGKSDWKLEDSLYEDGEDHGMIIDWRKE